MEMSTIYSKAKDTSDNDHLDHHDGLVLSWKNLSVTARSKSSIYDRFNFSSSPMAAKVEVILLDNISGEIKGGIWSVMGPSGSGKTTLLSALSLRTDLFQAEVTSSGLLLNGKPYTKSQLKEVSGYVMQDDLIHATLTVGETIAYTAELRLPSTLPKEEVLKRQHDVLVDMGIDHRKDIIVGDSRHKGISGGERKRLCVAMELLTNPKLLFLDEPTSGLDSATALALIEQLKKLNATHGCTVVCTIHQPQAKIYSLFDNLILMTHGKIAYIGAADKAITHFAKLGYECPPGTNPADFLIDNINTFEYNNGATPAISYDNIIVVSSTEYDNLEKVPSKLTNPWYLQFYILLRRNIYFHICRYDLLFMNLLITVVIAIFVSGSVWKDIGLHKASSSRRQPALFYCVIHQGIVSSLQGTHTFPLERSTMLRERAAGMYCVSAYFLAKTVADMLVQLIPPIVFSLIVYPVIGYQPAIKKFFIFLGFLILDSAAATSLSNMISCLCVSIEMSTIVLAACYEISRLYGGWFISPYLLDLYPQWRFADAISYIKYAFIGVSLNENDGLELTCLPSELQNGLCTMPPLPATSTGVYTGDSIDVYYGYDMYTMQFCAGILIAYIVICRLIAYLALRYIKV